MMATRSFLLLVVSYLGHHQDKASGRVAVPRETLASFAEDWRSVSRVIRAQISGRTSLRLCALADVQFSRTARESCL